VRALSIRVRVRMLLTAHARFGFIHELSFSEKEEKYLGTLAFKFIFQTLFITRLFHPRKF